MNRCQGMKKQLNVPAIQSMKGHYVCGWVGVCVRERETHDDARKILGLTTTKILGPTTQCMEGLYCHTKADRQQR